MKRIAFLKYIFPLIFFVGLFVAAFFTAKEVPTIRHYEDIAKNGTLVEATITDRYETDRDDDDDYKVYYKFKYEFEVDGLKYTGTTRSSYKEYTTLGRKRVGDTIRVRYNEKMESVEDAYRADDMTMKLISAICGVLSLAALTVFIVFVVKGCQNFAIAKNGELRQGTYLSCDSNTRVNGRALFRVNYYWNKPNGERVESRTSSRYTFDEANYFQKVNTFDIKTKGNKSVIVEEPFTKSIVNETVLNTYNSTVTAIQNAVNNNMVKCSYCNSTFDSRRGKCPTCGAPISKE